MPSLPISGLPAGGAVGSTNPFPTVQGGVTVQVPASALATFVLAGAPLLIHGGYVSGRTYSNALRVATPVATVSHLLNSVEYSPLIIPQPVVITSFGIKTGSTNAASGQTNVGLYTNSGGLPGSLFNTVATNVAIPATANTNVTITPGGNITLSPGFYWFATQFDTTINMAGDALSALMIWTGGTTNTAAWFAATSSVIGYTEAANYAGGLPATATPVSTVNAITSGVLKVA